MDLHWNITDDGSFDITGTDWSLTGCYPSWDDAALRPQQVRVQRAASGGSIVYQLLHGELTLRLEHDGEALLLTAELQGCDRTPRLLAPLADADCRDADRCFRQGRSMPDNRSGCLPLPSGSDLIHSDALFALSGSTDALIIASSDPRSPRCHFRLRPGLEEGDPPRLDATFHLEAIPAAGGLVLLPSLRISRAADCQAGLRAAAAAVPNRLGLRQPLPPQTGWCSWYHHYDFMNDEVLRDTLAGLTALPVDERPRYLQIDDGYMPHAGDWLEPDQRYPGGLQAAFAAIRETGFAAGVWVAPFMVGCRSRLAQEHPDWLVRDRNGAILIERRQYDRMRIGGDGDEELYVLDTTHPDARSHLHDVFRQLRDWGATVFKTDFLRYGDIPAHRCRRHDPSRTGAAVVGDCLDLIRDAIGNETYLIGCIGPFAPQLGRVDACRVATDTSPALGCFYTVFRDTAGVQHLNGSWFATDPDCLLLRAEHNHKPDAELRADALWNAMLGGTLSTSDPIHHYDERRRALWRFVCGDTRPIARPWRAHRIGEQDVYGLIAAYPQGSAVLLLNRNGDEPRTVLAPLQELIGQERAPVWTWGPEGSEALGEHQQLAAELAPRAARLWWVSPNASPPPDRL